MGAEYAILSATGAAGQKPCSVQDFFKEASNHESSQSTACHPHHAGRGLYGPFAVLAGQDRSPLYPDLRKRAVSLSSELQKPSPSLNGLRRPGWGICVLYNRNPLKKHRRLIVSGAFRQNIPFSNLFRIPEGTSCTGTSGRGPAP